MFEKDRVESLGLSPIRATSHLSPNFQTSPICKMETSKGDVCLTGMERNRGQYVFSGQYELFFAS